MSKLRIAVIMGGRSTEHEVSLRSGAGVVNHLDSGEYEICPVIILKDGKWRCGTEYRTYGNERKFEPAAFLENASPPEAVFPSFLLAEAGRPDLVFPILHGRFGEDGTLQGLLEMTGLPYTGSGVLGSSLAMHKRKAKEMYRHHGIPTPEYSFYSRRQWEAGGASITRHLVEKLGLPLFVKVPEGGSSIGVGRAASRDEVRELAGAYFRESDEVLFEKSIKGTEVSCGVLDTLDGGCEALVPTEIAPVRSDFFDYAAKYEKGACREITPARITPVLTEKVRKCAKDAHAALHCSDFSRTDLMIAGGKLYVLETNTLPGFTETSLLPQGAAAAGLSYSGLLDRIIGCALKRAGR